MAATASSPSAAVPAVDTAERRQLTVMFCDLAGSTVGRSSLTPRTCHRSYAEAIARNVGFVAKYLGDGVLAYFGYPEAHEHDAELAVKAGLAIVEAVPKLATPNGSPLHVRVGIATGIVVVGDIVYSGEF